MRLGHHRRSAREGRGAGERGVTLVEAAFALPIFIMFLFALVDVGGAVLQSSQSSSAAADGARAAIVLGDLTGAETSGPAHDKIVAAVKARLVGAASDDVVITIKCVTASGSTYTCGNEGSLRDRAQIEVDVSWSWKPVTFVGHAMPIENITSRATMGLIVLPDNFPTSTPPVTP